MCVCVWGDVKLHVSFHVSEVLGHIRYYFGVC